MLISWSNLILSLVFNLGVIERMKRDCLEKPDISGKEEEIYHETSLKMLFLKRYNNKVVFPTQLLLVTAPPACLFELLNQHRKSAEIPAGFKYVTTDAARLERL